MPIPKLEYTVLLSCPSDLSEEKRVAAEVIAEIETSWGCHSNVVLNVLSWENVPPGFASEAQEVINQRFGETWDIYLGLMHSRFGTPTKKFGSGTEEEFENAYNLWKADQSKRTIMFYFKTAPVAIDQIDPEQIIKVRTFQKKLSQKGGLYQEFANIENFRNFLRPQLTSALVDLHNRQISAPAFSEKILTEIKATVQPVTPELGLFDYIKRFASEAIELTDAINGINKHMEDSAKKLGGETIMLNQATSKNDFDGISKSITAISNSMLLFAKGLGEKVEFIAKFQGAFSKR